MKNYLSYIILFLVTIGNDSFAIAPNTSISLPQNSGEEIQFYTDRTLYVCNEPIYFAANYFTDVQVPNNTWSSILYVELIRWNGEVLHQTKVPIAGDKAKGSIKIPSTLLSGNYYLRAYTKWMRNYSNNAYAYIPIKIINPYRSAIDAGTNSNNSIETINTETKNTDKICYTFNSPQLTINKPTTLNIHVPDDFTTSEYLVTIVKKGSLQFYNNLFTSSNKETVTFKFLPETNGVGISGKLINKNTNEALAGKPVILSTPVTGEYYSAFITNNDGLFYFSLPNSVKGTKDIFIHAEQRSIGCDFLIDNDFCTRAIQLPYIPFQLSGNEEKLAKELVINMQLTKAYSSVDSTLLQTREVPFYGKAEKVYLALKYIELPNVEEFINELIIEFTIVKNNKIKEIQNNTITSYQNIPSLVLIDNIPVKNHEMILRLPVKNIDRIEVISKPFIAANQTYNGILHIYSKNKDFAGHKVQENSLFFNYHLTSNLPAKTSKTVKQKHVPNCRNTLYFNPEVPIQAGETTQIPFTTSTNPGDYVVYLIGEKKSTSSAHIHSYQFTVE